MQHWNGFRLVEVTLSARRDQPEAQMFHAQTAVEAAVVAATDWNALSWKQLTA